LVSNAVAIKMFLVSLYVISAISAMPLRLQRSKALPQSSQRTAAENPE
jgi:hypothetical protein